MKMGLVTAISHTVRREAGVGVERLFDTVVAEDVLPKVLHRWGPIPAVVGTRDLTGPWTVPGSERTVVLDDESTARERLVWWERPRRFEYVVDRLTSPLGRLVDHATGVWEFDERRDRSSFRWTYSFHPRNLAASAVLRLVVGTGWARYMAQCADLTVELALTSD
jgi:Polyketide cyclase / dehydrase and lipid transport